MASQWVHEIDILRYTLAIQLHLVAWISGAGALSPTRVPGYAMRTYSRRPSSSIRFSTLAAMATCDQVADLGLQPGFLLTG
jgi:hypothetical protein